MSAPAKPVTDMTDEELFAEGQRLAPRAFMISRLERVYVVTARVTKTRSYEITGNFGDLRRTVLERAVSALRNVYARGGAPTARERAECARLRGTL